MRNGLETFIVLPLKEKRRGFTLIELLVVIVIIGILMGIGVVAYSGLREHALRDRANGDLERLSQGLFAYIHQFGGDYPVQLEHRDGRNAIAELIEGLTTTLDLSGPLLETSAESQPDLRSDPFGKTGSMFFLFSDQAKALEPVFLDLNKNGTVDAGENIFPMVDPWNRPYVFSVTRYPGSNLAMSIELYSFGPKVLVDDKSVYNSSTNSLYRDDDIYGPLE